MAEMFNSAPSLENDPVKQQLKERIDRLINEAKIRDNLQKSTDQFEGFKNLVQSKMVEAVRNKTAPWLNSHDGNKTHSFFPVNGYVPQGVTAVWLKLRETEMHTTDPRWFSRKEIFDNGIRIKAGEKATIMSFKSGEEIKHAYYWNASQLDVPEYKRDFTIQNKKIETYYPESLHPRDTLRADLTNWMNSLTTHSPYEPKGLNRTNAVADFLTQSKPGTSFFIAKDASETSRKMNSPQKSESLQKTNNELCF